MKITAKEEARRKKEDLEFYKQVVLAFLRSSGEGVSGHAVAVQASSAGETAVQNLQNQRGLIDESYV